MSRTALPKAPNARVLAGVFLCLLLQGCAFLAPQADRLETSWPAGVPDAIELSAVPFFPQEEYQCGPAALATAMVHAGAQVSPEALVAQVYLPARKGSLQVEMLAAPRSHGLVGYRLAPSFEDVMREVASGNPVIVLLGYGLRPFKYWHYADVVGFDRGKREVVLRSGTRERLPMPFAVLEYTWKESAHWAMVVARPERIPVTASESAYLEAVAAMARVAPPRTVAVAYAKFLERWPENLSASLGLANAHHALGELPRAEAVLRRAATRHPDSVPLLNNLAQTLSDQGRHDEALRYIERAVADPGPFAEATRETHALILGRMGKR